LRRTEKEAYVQDLKDKLDRSSAVFITEYSGIKAVEMTGFRQTLRDNETGFKVIRNTLARRALEGRSEEMLTEFLDRPVALAFSFGDAAQSAKTLVEFAKEHKELKLLGAVVSGRLVQEDEIKALATLPSRDVLIAKLLGCLNSPISGFVGVLSGVQRKFLYALRAIAESKSD